MLQKLVKKKLEELSRHLYELPTESGSGLGAFVVPSPEGDSEALIIVAIGHGNGRWNLILESVVH